MYVVNYDAMYWKQRCLEAEAALEVVEQQLTESVNLNVLQADTSSRNLLHAIMGGAFDSVRQCTACKGSGEDRVPGSTDTCGRCNGSGKEPTYRGEADHQRTQEDHPGS